MHNLFKFISFAMDITTISTLLLALTLYLSL